MGNKAKNSKESILCDTKELLKLFDKVTWHLTDARRAHGAVKRFEDAGYHIIHCCTIAMEMRGKIGKEWWQWLAWDDRRKCLVFQEYYSPNRRLDRKYKLHLKRYRNDKTRNPRGKEQCSENHPRSGGSSVLH